MKEKAEVVGAGVAVSEELVDEGGSGNEGVEGVIVVFMKEKAEVLGVGVAVSAGVTVVDAASVPGAVGASLRMKEKAEEPPTPHDGTTHVTCLNPGTDV